MIISDGTDLTFKLSIDPTEMDVNEVLEIYLKYKCRDDGLVGVINKFMKSESYEGFRKQLTSKGLLTQESFEREFNTLCASEEAKDLRKELGGFHEESKILITRIKDILDNKDQNRLEMFLCAIMAVDNQRFDSGDIMINFSYLNIRQLENFSQDILTKVKEQLDTNNVTVH